jgi:ABC transport system ATP-binding/permease protein
MSEDVLKTVLRLFAAVARIDDVTEREKEQVRGFLEDHVSQPKIIQYLREFEQLALSDGQSGSEEQELEKLCSQINPEITQRQKVIIVLELIRIIAADSSISAREDELVKIVSRSFRVSDEETNAFEVFLSAKSPELMDIPNVLVVDDISDTSLSKAYHLMRSGLKGFIGILWIESANLYCMKYAGHADVFLNGVHIKSGGVRILPVGGCVRWGDSDEPVYYGDVLSMFKNFAKGSRITFVGTNISYAFKNGKLGLRNVNLAEESGRLIALMGASGAGKSTLLHVLNGSEKPSSGQVLINGIDVHKEPDRIEGIIGFVPQDDLLIEDLTVYQNLYYAAKLCFSHKSEQEIDELVLRVLDDLGLSETRDLKVGSPLRKTISGGQRKRLNIGLELLREPAVLFCDEPTSGLSSRDSENIIDLLKELSLKGKLVFTVIHQPSSDIFKMFDKLLILDTGGYQIYYGNPIDAVVYFKKSINLLDSEEGECHTCGNVNPEQIFNIIETKVINEYGNFTSERKITPEQWNRSYKAQERILQPEPNKEKPESTLQIPGRLKQAHLFSLRDIQAKLHNTQYLVINLLEAPLLAFILAFIVRYHNVDDKIHTGYEFGKNLNVPAYLFMSVIVALFMGLTVSAEEIIRDRKILKREAFLHLSRSSYIVSKVSILFMLSALQTLTFVLVGNAILGIDGMLLNHWAILFSVSCFANLLGLNISSSFNSAVTIYILIPLLLIPQLILSGVVVHFDKLNPVIGNTATVPFVGDVMASRWAFEASMVTQFKDNKYEKEFYLYDKVMANADYKKIYFLPELGTRLQYCLQFHGSKDPHIRSKLESDYQLIRHELGNEIEIVGSGKQPFMDNIYLDKFDSATYVSATDFLEKLKKFYINRFNKADQEREKKIHGLTDTPEKEKAFETFRDSYHNLAIADLVKNVTEQHRVIEKNGKLVQKIYPVYKDPDPEHLVDFDAQFYMPSKHFLTRNIDTLYFNMAVIWSMTILLVITLYFDVLRKLIDGLANLTNPVYRK